MGGGLVVVVVDVEHVVVVVVAEPVAAAVTGPGVAESASAPCNVVSILGSCSQEHPRPYLRKLLEPCTEGRRPAAIHVVCFVRFCAALIAVLPAESFPPPVSAGPPLPWH